MADRDQASGSSDSGSSGSGSGSAPSTSGLSKVLAAQHPNPKLSTQLKGVAAVLLVGFSPLWVPALLLAALMAQYVAFLLVAGALTEVDKHFNTNPFEPGRWEADNGVYWVELRPDGTGTVYLPNEHDWAASGCEPAPEPWTGAVLWTYEPDFDGYMTLHVEMVVQLDPNCTGFGPFLMGAGGWNEQYNWNHLYYSEDDPDSVDLTLDKVED